MHDKAIALIVLAIGCLVFNHYWHKNTGMTDKFERIKKALKSFANRDMLWDEVLLKKVASETFEEYRNAMDTFHSGEYQSRGPAFNYQAIKHLLHPNATTEAKSGNRDRFSFDSVVVQARSKINVRIIHARNSADDSKDTFTACIDVLEFKRVHNRGPADEILGFEPRNLLLGGDSEKDHFKEFWTFQRLGNKWLLLCIHDEHNWEMFTEMRILDEGKITSKKKV
jgi:hypothetical protein